MAIVQSKTVQLANLYVLLFIKTFLIIYDFEQYGGHRFCGFSQFQLIMI